MTSRTKRFIRITSLVFILSLFLIVSLAYIKYRDFKKAFVAQLSLQTSSFIGQEITIGDISFSPGGEINLYNIAVHNPEGFAPGNLLTIKMLSLKMSYKEFMRKKLYFERIDLQEPELTVMRNSKGLLNISDELREFFARKPTLPYQIDEFIIQSGIVNFNNDKKYRNEDVNIVIQNLSPERDTKTSLRGHTLYAGSRMEIDGWVYLKDEPKRLSISISSRDLSLSVLKESLSEYGIEITKTKAALFLKAEGDTAKGFNFSSELRIKDAKFSFLKKDAKEIFLKVQAFLNIPGKTLIIDNCSLNAGGVTAMTVKGELKKVKEDFTYTAGVKINMLDLSVVNFVKDVTMSGMVNSEDLHLRGSLKNLFPELSGNVQLRDAKFETRDFGIGQMNTDMQFLSGKDATLDFTVRDLKYGDYKIPWLQAKSGIAYRGHIITLQSPDIVSKDFTVSSQHAVIKLPVNTKQHGVQVEIGGMHASYPERKAGIKNGACSLVVSKVSNVFAGTCGFAADEIVFMDIRTGFVKGHGIFDEKHYSVDITQADLFGGRLGLTAGGRTSGDRFPITIRSTANNINLEYLSRDISKIANISYPLSGDVTSADFEGTIDSV